MRHHDFIQKKILGHLSDYLNKNNLEWNEFMDEITNFDRFDCYIDQLVYDDEKILALQYFYSHTNNDGKLSELKNIAESNIWVNHNIKYYKEVEKMFNKENK